MTLTLIAAVGRNGVIGRDNDLPWRTPDGTPWRLPGDLARFKALTLGHPIVMGRRTYESIGRPLPGRHTVVVTRQTGWRADGVEVAHSVADALQAASRAAGSDNVFVVGGGEIYRGAMPLADRLELTEVEQEPIGDVTFPAYDDGSWTAVHREQRDGFAWVRYERS